MNDLGITLKAKNSSGEQTLHLSEEDGGYWFTLCGEYRGSPIQIDFDEMARGELEELREQIDIILACSA